MSDETPAGANPADRLAAHRWPRGTSGNPGGRPRGGGLTALIRRRLDETHNGKTIAEILVDALIKGAAQGKHQHLKELLDRVEGKVADRVQVGEPGEGLVINVVRRSDAAARAGAERTERVELPPGSKVVVGECWETA
ncbi:MAG: DUF5681 domain-containing protein [Phycisphaerales bacterium]